MPRIRQQAASVCVKAQGYAGQQAAEIYGAIQDVAAQDERKGRSGYGLTPFMQSAVGLRCQSFAVDDRLDLGQSAGTAIGEGHLRGTQAQGGASKPAQSAAEISDTHISAIDDGRQVIGHAPTGGPGIGPGGVIIGGEGFHEIIQAGRGGTVF